jgi:hypothetical protein
VKQWAWNGVHSASWVQLSRYLEEKLAAPVKTTENTFVGIRCADRATSSIRTNFADKLARSVYSLTEATEYIGSIPNVSDFPAEMLHRYVVRPVRSTHLAHPLLLDFDHSVMVTHKRQPLAVFLLCGLFLTVFYRPLPCRNSGQQSSAVTETCAELRGCWSRSLSRRASRSRRSLMLLLYEE